MQPDPGSPFEFRFHGEQRSSDGRDVVDLPVLHGAIPVFFTRNMLEQERIALSSIQKTGHATCPDIERKIELCHRVAPFVSDV